MQEAFLCLLIFYKALLTLILLERGGGEFTPFLSKISITQKMHLDANLSKL